MSNTPRFRVWDKKYSKMYYEGICVYEDGSFDLDRTSETNDKIEVVSSDSGQLVLMLSVGLTDKNCKRIYEGDVVMPLYGNEPHAVIWDQGTCSFDLVRNGHSEHLFDTTGAGDMGHNHWEVIGNIYEHGHLLEE